LPPHCIHTSLMRYLCCCRPPAILLFFSTSCRHPRHLHSFPTRRSSDLERSRPAAAKYRLFVPKEHVQWAAGTGIPGKGQADMLLDRKSTRLNSSHGSISYAVFCLKKKKKRKKRTNKKSNTVVDRLEIDR